jgi:hypothetical protein
MAYQRRYIAYARAHSLTPDEILARDSAQCPCHWLPFSVWIQARWREWAKLTGHRRPHQFNFYDHAAFDAWLNVQE